MLTKEKTIGRPMQCKQNDNPKLQVEQRSRDVN